MMARNMTREERKAANASLLELLAEAKKRFGPVQRKADYLRDSRISTLANTLLLLNLPLANRVIRKTRASHAIPDTPEEMESLGLTGRGSEKADVGGMLGAILSFDPEQHAVEELPGYLATSIVNAYSWTQKECRTHEMRKGNRSLNPIDRECSHIDPHSPDPARLAQSNEVLGILRDCVTRLPVSEQYVATTILDTVTETGRAPQYEAICDSLGISRDSVRTLATRTWDHLGAELHRRAPQLAKDWKRWEVFRAGLGRQGVPPSPAF